GRLARGTADLCVVGGALLGLGAAALVGGAAVLVGLGALAVLLAYSPILKRRGFAGNLAVALVAGLPLQYGALAVGRPAAGVVPWALAAWLHLVREIVKDLGDEPGDRVMGRRTLPVVIGARAAGRGRDGRTWHSPHGGVWLGVLFRPQHTVLGTIGIRAGLAVADTVDALLGGPVARLKWPNDVLLDDRKLAGILCEGRWQGERLQWLAVGVGVNVRNAVPPAVASRAIALEERLPDVRRIDVLDRLVPALVRGATLDPALSEAECAAFALRDWLRGRQLRSPAAGRAGGLRPDGALLV